MGIWYELPKAQRKRKIKAWMLRCFEDDDGKLYVPAVLAASPMEVMLCASFDGVGMILDGKSKDAIYAPADWMEREYPDTSSAIDRIRENILKSKEEKCS